MRALWLAGEQGTVMQQVDDHVTAPVPGTCRTLRLLLFGMAMVLTISAAAALPILLLG